MSVSLLSTKLHIPSLRANGILRPRLTEKLRTGLQLPGRFALLSGPAGFGKTTLLSEFVAEYQRAVAWVSLDEGDNDPVRFWTYLITACQSIQHEIGESGLALLQAPQSLPDETIPTLLINDMTRLEKDLLLILDDYHTIQNVSIHAGVSFLLDQLPEKLHLVISTRVDPPWPLARFRAHDRLVEFRALDLRFTMSETYQSKRERWQRMQMALPAELRLHVSLRNVEAVSALSPKAQARLAEAIRAGLKRLPRAIEQLRENADTPLAELLNRTQVTDTQFQGEFSKDVQGELADLVQACYPDMPRVSAEALTEAEAMLVAGKLAEAFDAVFASRHLKADFVLIVVYALVAQSLDRLETLIADTPAVQQVLAQSDLPHIPHTLCIYLNRLLGKPDFLQIKSLAFPI